MFVDSKRTAAKTAVSITAVLLAGAAVPAEAQENSQADTNEQLLACGGVTDQAERMACFDAVVERLAEYTAVPDATPPEPQPASVADAPDMIVPAVAAGRATAAMTAGPAEPAPAAGIDVAPAAVVPGSADSPSDAAGVTTTSGAAAPEPAPEPAPVAVVPDRADSQASGDAAMANFGLEVKQEKPAKKDESRKEDELRSLEATIVEAWETIDHRFEVRLDNGQVWRETERTRTDRLPKDGTKVRITKGTLGSYNMKIGNNNRIAAVRRTK